MQGQGERLGGFAPPPPTHPRVVLPLRRTRDKSTSALLSSANIRVTAPGATLAVEQSKAVPPAAAAAAGVTATAATADPDAGAFDPSDPKRRTGRRSSGIVVEKRPSQRKKRERVQARGMQHTVCLSGFSFYLIGEHEPRSTRVLSTAVYTHRL